MDHERGFAAGSPLGAAAEDRPSDAEVEAARLALDLAHERAQRQKAERDFEVTLTSGFSKLEILDLGWMQ